MSGAVVPVQVSTHFAVPLASEHTGAVVVQATPQPPQLGELPRSASQPSSGRGEQWANPLTHALAGTEQTPAWQVTPVAPDATLGSAPQSCPQVPQFLASVGEPHGPSGAWPSDPASGAEPSGVDTGVLMRRPCLQPVDTRKGQTNRDRE